MEMQGQRDSATAISCLQQLCKGNGSLQTTPPQNFSLSCTVHLGTATAVSELHSTKALILNTTNINCIGNRSKQKSSLGEVMDTDRFPKAGMYPCFHVFQSMPLLWTFLTWTPYRANHCFVQLFMAENVKKEYQICNDLWEQIPFSFRFL